MKRIDTEYYKNVLITQHSVEVLQSELSDLIDDVVEAQKDAVADVPCNGGLAPRGDRE